MCLLISMYTEIFLISYKMKNDSCTMFPTFICKNRNIVQVPPFNWIGGRCTMFLVNKKCQNSQKFLEKVVVVLWCLLSIDSKHHSTSPILLFLTIFDHFFEKLVVVLWCLLSIKSKHHSTSTSFWWKSGRCTMFPFIYLKFRNIVQLPLFCLKRWWFFEKVVDVLWCLLIVAMVIQILKYAA